LTLPEKYIYNGDPYIKGLTYFAAGAGLTSDLELFSYLADKGGKGVKTRRLKKVVLLLILALILAFLPVLVQADVIQFDGDQDSMAFGVNPLSGTPEYSWYHGCSPTSGGMLMGYWAAHGYAKLLPNVTNPMVQTAAVNNDISSAQHNVKDTWQGHTANSIADFMKTVKGGSYLNNIAPGLAGWSNYTGVGAKTAYDSLVTYYGGAFSYSKFVTEINAGRPMLLNLITNAPGYGWVGHSVMGYGYRDNMFNLRIYNGRQYVNVSVPGFAVMDTWKNGAGAGKQSSWYGWNGQVVNSLLDSQGREWWPFLDMSLTKGYDYTNQWDWQVDDGVFYQPAGTASATNLRLGSNVLYGEGNNVPVPGSLWLFGSGLVGFLAWRRTRAG
jgi:hypothetical protein